MGIHEWRPDAAPDVLDAACTSTGSSRRIGSISTTRHADRSVNAGVSALRGAR